MHEILSSTGIPSVHGNHGGPSGFAWNVAAPLAQLARTQGNVVAVIEPHGSEGRRRPAYRHFTYRELEDESNRLAQGLERIGIGRGVRTVLMVRPSLEFFALTFALFKVGAVLVLIDPGMGMRSLGRCLEEVAPEAFIGIPRAQLARRLLGWGRHSLRTTVTVGRRLGCGGVTLEAVRRQADDEVPGALAELGPEETCAILFTSGSTGIAKGVLYTHERFAAQVEVLRHTYGIEAGEVDLATFPLFALFAPALGMTAIIPEMDATRPARVDPRKILGAIRHFGVTNLFGSPALLHPVASHALGANVQLSTLRRVLSAGAPVHWRVLENLDRVLPAGVETYTPYGATEALPVCNIGSREILSTTRHRAAQGGGVCVGQPVAGMEVKIVRIRDEAIPVWTADLELPAGEVGEIAVRGPVVTRAYHARPEQTALAKIDAPEQGSFYHRMGDLGYRDDQGRIWFCGRKSQRVQTPAGTLYTVCCEGIFNSHPSVFRSALVGIPGHGGSEPVLCVQLLTGVARLQQPRLKQELLQLAGEHAMTRSIRRVLFHPAFPVDVRHNAKINREQLAVWAARQGG